MLKCTTGQTAGVDDECIHLNDPALCTICNGKDAAGKRSTRTPAAAKAPGTPATPRKAAAKSTASKRLRTSVVTTMSADTPESVEQYRDRFPDDRQDTIDANVLVFFNSGARDFAGGFLNFMRCASADPERKETSPALVVRAEHFMRDAGYAADDSGRPQKPRRWHLEDA
jgi:hypothetical protein